MFKLPMVPRILRQMFSKPATNPFPSHHLPRSVTEFLDLVSKGEADLLPPVCAPEGFKGKITYEAADCTGCSLCARVCPANAIEVYKEEKCIVIYAGHCIQCAQCTEVCGKSSLSMSEEFLTATTDRYEASMIIEREAVLCDIAGLCECEDEAESPKAELAAPEPV